MGAEIPCRDPSPPALPSPDRPEEACFCPPRPTAPLCLARPPQPPPPVQVNWGSRGRPSLPLGGPALTHPACEVAALAGVPGKKGAGSSPSPIPSCSPASVLPFLFSPATPPPPSSGRPVAPRLGPQAAAQAYPALPWRSQNQGKKEGHTAQVGKHRPSSLLGPVTFWGSPGSCLASPGLAEPGV